jgi:hypothetical protein
MNFFFKKKTVIKSIDQQLEQRMRRGSFWQQLGEHTTARVIHAPAHGDWNKAVDASVGS